VYLYLSDGRYLGAMKPMGAEEEELTEKLAANMELCIEAFTEWDMKDNPIGFLDHAKSILQAE
jgi:hypothetical protein